MGAAGEAMGETSIWSPERIRTAIRDKGISQAALARENGLSEAAVRNAILNPGPAAEKVISEFLGVPLQELWPSRYYPDGRPRTLRRRPRDPNANRFPPHRQNRGAP